MNINLFNILIDFITNPIFVSIIGVISFISAIIALIVAWMAYQLQKKSDKDIQRIEKDIGRLENSAQSISEIQDKLAFETEKNRLMDATKDIAVSKENKKDIEDGIIHIFNNQMFIISIKDQSNREYHCVITFIRESNKPYALPKMYYPFNQIHSFPYFCIYVTKVYLFKTEPDSVLNKKLISEFKIQKGNYYLHYHLSLSDKNKTGWYIAKRYPITQGLKFIFSYTVYEAEKGISADDFCKKF